MSGPYFDSKGRQLAAGETPFGSQDGIYQGPVVPPKHDPALDRPKRACTNCGKRFQPTVRRRLLCQGCFGNASVSPMEPVGASDTMPGAVPWGGGRSKRR